MKTKRLLVLLLIVSVALLTGCKKTPQVTEKDEVAPIISGVKAIYYEIGEETPDYLAGVNAFDETDGSVTSSIVVDTKSVNLGVEGIYEIIYYAFDLSGNKATKTTTVTVSKDETMDFEQPNYPEREGLIKADINSLVREADDDVKLDVLPPLITINYNEAAAADNSWQTNYTIDLALNSYVRKTHLGINIFGGGASIYFKLLTKSGQKLVLEREISSTATWREILFEIPDTQRKYLDEALILMIYAPKPGTTTSAGTVMISGIWFEGDKEPASQDGYDPDDYAVIYSVDLSNISNQYDEFEDDGLSKNGLIQATFDSDTGTLTFQNNGFNGWANMAFQIPDKDSGGNPLKLNEVLYVVIEMSVTDGAVVKAKSDWSLPDLFEYDGPTDGTKQYWVLPMGPSGYVAWGAISFAPSYLKTGVSESTIVIYSIKLVGALE